MVAVPFAAMDLGAASHGSGTTPSLMSFGEDEDKLVVISDGNPDGAQLVAFWRDEVPLDFRQKPGTKSRRIASKRAGSWPTSTTPTGCRLPSLLRTG
jgi:hypothetical protein